MKKTAILLLMVLTGILLCAAASAQTLSLDSIHAEITIDDSYLIMTPDNLDSHRDWVMAQGRTADELAQEWVDDGVLVVASLPDRSAQLVISALKDDDAQQYYDLDQQTAKTRNAYRSRFSKTGFRDQGYTYTSAEWKKASRYGRMLLLRYSRSLGSDTYRGFAYRTIRNGYTIILDYQVFGRTLKNRDLKALNAMMKTFSFTQVLNKPVEAVGKVRYTELPPTETNTGKFTVSGTCDPGITFEGVVTRMSSSDKVLVSGEANEKGRFSISVQLPNEGYWLMTLSTKNGNEEIQEDVFDVINYGRMLLPIQFNTDFTAPVGTQEMSITGKTVKNVQIQCLSSSGYDKSVKTNGSGKFSFKVPMKEEGEYEIVLVFQKKNYSTRRFTYNVRREVTEGSRRSAVRKEAVKPAYSTLTKKLTGYTGRIMGYNLYYIDGQESGDDWVLTMAMTSGKKGYKNLVYVIAPDNPGFELGSQHKMYGTCTGSYTVSDGESSVTYPCFELLFWDE